MSLLKKKMCKLTTCRDAKMRSVDSFRAKIYHFILKTIFLQLTLLLQTKHEAFGRAPSLEMQRSVHHDSDSVVEEVPPFLLCHLLLEELL